MLWDMYSEVGLLDHTLVPFLICLRTLPTLFHRDCTILQSHQQCIEIQFLFILTNTIFFFLYSSHPNQCEVIWHFSFDLHFSDDWWCWASLHMLVGHLHILFGERSSQVLCLKYIFFILKHFSRPTMRCPQLFPLLPESCFPSPGLHLSASHSLGCIGQVSPFAFSLFTLFSQSEMSLPYPLSKPYLAFKMF